MIEKLSIRNFAANQRLDIELDKHITCITGESYTGKSWMFRAIKWVSLNYPAGTRYIRWGKKRAIVSLIVDGQQVVRRRSKSENIYINRGRELEGFGNDVPAKIAKLLNLSDLNFQIQQEMPHGNGPLFWFALTPGQVSKRLNRIVDLDIIDRTLANLQSYQRKAKAELVVCRQRREDAKEQMKDLSFVEQMKTDWQDVKSHLQKAEDASRQCEALEELLADVHQQKDIIQQTRIHLSHIESDLRELEVLRSTIIDIKKDIKHLSDLLDDVESLEIQRADAIRTLQEAQTKYDKTMSERCPLCGSRKKKQ